MASELNPAEQNNPKSGESRRSFLAKLGIGAAALALVGGPFTLSKPFAVNSGNSAAAMNQEFPDEDSIFHPAVDPRRPSGPPPQRPSLNEQSQIGDYSLSLEGEGQGLP